MAISGGDGSIILDTRVNTAGVNKGLQTIKNTVSQVGKALAGVFAVREMIRFSNTASQMATQTEASVQRLIDIYGEAAQSVGDFIDANARAIGMSKASASSFASVYGNLFSVWADQNTNAELTNRYLNMTAVVASKTGRTVQDVQERIRSGLLGNTEAIEDLGVFVNVKTIEMTDAFQRMADGKSWEQLDAYTQQQVRTMAILEQATAKYGNTVADTTATTRAQYQAAYEDFQNTWGQVVNAVLIPVLKVMTQIFNIATKGLQIITGLSGKTIQNSKQQENSIAKSVDNQKELTKEIEKTNKAQKKSLADFDEIQKLTKETSKTDNSGKTDNSNMNAGIGNINANYDNSFVDKISGDMTAIMGIIGGVLVAVGLLLIFFGNIGWGIGFIIAGAGIFAVSMATLSSSDQVTPISEKLMSIMAIAGIALTAIGLILLFAGIWKWGIGFIIAGAFSLGVAIVSVKSGKATKKAEKMLLDIMLIAGSALLAIGIILLLVGQISPLSIGLVVAGASTLAGAVAINPTKTFNEIKKFFKDNAGLIVGISLALLVLGIILCFTGVGIPLAIGLIVAGAGGLATEVALNWNKIKDKVTEIFNNIINWVKKYGLLVLGIILCLTGVGIPLGIALIVKWAKDGAEKGIPLANAIVDKVKEIWAKVKQFWNTYIAVIFTKQWWLNLAKKCGNGLITGFESGINGIIRLFENMINFVVNGLNKFIRGVDTVISAVGNVFGQDWGVATIPNVSLSRVSIPRLAQGAVIPPNREFLAVLGDQKHGTNIEAPADLIKQMVNEALIENGANQQINIVAKGDLDSIISLFKFEIEKQDRLAGATI